ncbi:MAG TPA: hypothetical protein DCR48_02630 [Flavobacteriales bacterium]|nr:hypothetical protein [Flavobacteriales bacterium]
MNVLTNHLKQARRRTNLSVKDMAFILQMDSSNLSKYELRKLYPTLRVALCYHILSKTPLEKFFIQELVESGDSLVERIKMLLEQIDTEDSSHKNLIRSESLGTLLSDLTKIDLTENGSHE